MFKLTTLTGHKAGPMGSTTMYRTCDHSVTVIIIVTGLLPRLVIELLPRFVTGLLTRLVTGLLPRLVTELLPRFVTGLLPRLVTELLPNNNNNNFLH